MRGGIFHNFLVRELFELCRQRGFRGACEVATKKGRDTGYVDLVVYEKTPLLIEVELTTARVRNDIQKLQEFGHHAKLWIVTPNARVARLIKVQVGNFNSDELQVSVLSFGSAKKKLNELHVPKHLQN